MPFALTREQRDLAEGVESLLAARATGVYVRDVVAGRSSWRDLWAEVAEIGIAALMVSEEDGGLGLGAAELVAVAEVCGRYLAPGPIVATAGWFVPPLAAAGGEAAAASLAAVLQDGVAATLGYPESLTRSGRVRLEGDRLTVEDLLIADAERVDLVGFIVDDEEGPRYAVVGADVLQIEAVDGLDPSRPLGRVNAAGVPAAVSSLQDVRAPLALPRISAAAELVGTATRMLEISVQYAGEREQFGTKIGSFQGVKHQLVDAHLLVERARSLTFRAAVLADDRETTTTSLTTAARLALAAASEAATETARTAVQVHGGVGVTAEHDISLFYLRARQASMQLGGRDENYLAAARTFVRDDDTG